MRRRTTILTAIGASLLISTAVLAHEGATGIIKERMEDMKVMGKTTKAIAPIAMGATDLDKEALINGAKTISEKAKASLSKFPEGSMSDVSEAKSTIWTDWATFEKQMNKLSDDALALVAATEAGDKAAMAQSFGAMAGNCKACHKMFREKK